MYPQLAGKRIILFLGRLHPKKGLTMLLHAWARSASSFDDAHLVLAGPDFEGTRATLENLVDELGIRHQVTFTGMLTGPLKWGALAAASVFVLPSFFGRLQRGRTRGARNGSTSDRHGRLQHT